MASGKRSRNDERRLATFGLGGLVRALRLTTFLDHPFDHALADPHLQMVHRGLVRQREHVDAFPPLRGGVDEALLHLHAGGHAADGDLDVGEEQRRGDAAAIAFLEVQRTRRIAAVGVRAAMIGRVGRATAVRRSLPIGVRAVTIG